MKRLYLCLFLASLCPALASASSMAYVQGKVVDANTGRPIAGVHVSVKSPAGEASAVSGSDGFYMLWDAPIGQATLSFSREGFAQSAGTVCLRPGSTNTATIDLYDRLGGSAGRAEFAQWQQLTRAMQLDQTSNATWLGPC